MSSSEPQKIRRLSGGETGTVTLPKKALAESGYVNETGEVESQNVTVTRESENEFSVRILSF